MGDTFQQGIDISRKTCWMISRENYLKILDWIIWYAMNGHVVNVWIQIASTSSSVMSCEITIPHVGAFGILVWKNL